MNISKYSAFFHDGSLMDIKHVNNIIELSMSSAEVDEEEDIKGGIPLSKDNCIQGKLHVEGVKMLKISNKLIQGKFKKIYDNGSIINFQIIDPFVRLAIDWNNYPPNPPIDEFEIILIEAEKIWWENIPDLGDLYP